MNLWASALFFLLHNFTFLLNDFIYFLPRFVHYFYSLSIYIPVLPFFINPISSGISGSVPMEWFFSCSYVVMQVLVVIVSCWYECLIFLLLEVAIVNIMQLVCDRCIFLQIFWILFWKTVDLLVYHLNPLGSLHIWDGLLFFISAEEWLK